VSPHLWRRPFDPDHRPIPLPDRKDEPLNRGASRPRDDRASHHSMVIDRATGHGETRELLCELSADIWRCYALCSLPYLAPGQSALHQLRTSWLRTDRTLSATIPRMVVSNIEA